MFPSAHHPAVFFTHSGTVPEDAAPTSVGGTTIMLFWIRYEIPLRKEPSSMLPSAHHPALFFIHAGLRTMRDGGLMDR